MKRSNLAIARQLISLLESKDIDDLPYSVEIRSWGLTLRVQHDEITSEQMRELKRHFGPFTVTDQFGAKGLAGSLLFNDEHRIDLTISRAYTCEELDVDEITEEKWAEIKEHARHGRIKLQDCTSVAHKDANPEGGTG